jgi:hypothetical protein
MFYFYAQEEEKTHILQELNKIKEIENTIAEKKLVFENKNPEHIRELNTLDWERLKIIFELKVYKKNSMEKMKNSNDEKLIKQFEREEKIENKLQELENGSIWVKLEYEIKLNKSKENNKEITIDKIEKILDEVEIYKIERKI